ncbi:MAG: cytochrome P450 [Deltaproteobacteria bacterium]|nr:cytochrome P450 [Deltaproteobacteria bacterium]
MGGAAPRFETLDFGLHSFRGNELHETLTRLREAGPVVEVRFMNMPAFAVTRYDGLIRAFRDGERFPPERIYQMMFEPICGPTFQTLTGRDHVIRRRLATPALRAEAVRKQDEVEIVKLANELIEHFTHLFPFIIITRLLGVPRDAEREFRRWAQALLRFAEDHARAVAANAELTAYLEPIVAARREQPRDDIISDLVRAEVDGKRFTDEEVLSHVRLIFSAGAGTTHDAIGNLFYHLLSQPELWEMAKRDPCTRPGIVEEILRFEPPVAVLPRISASSPIEFDGVSIPPSAFMLFAISSANRDPSAFPDPNVFKTDRPPKPILTTFGPGPRMCPGQHLARKELSLVLDVVLERLPNLVLLDPDASQPVGAIIRGPHTLPVATG